MNVIFGGMILLACLAAAANGSAEAVSKAVFDSARAAVELSIGLIGYMAFFLGLMKIGEEAGLLKLLGRAIRPVMLRLFPDVPADHPAMGAMILNLAANMLGLGNAATPFGIKAMHELNRLNPAPGVATDAMVMFLAINTSGVALLPTTVVSVRAAEGSQDPWNIVSTSLIATSCSTLVGIFAARSLAPLFSTAAPADAAPAPASLAPEVELEEAGAGWGARLFTAALLLALAWVLLPPLALALLPGDHPRAATFRALSEAAGDWTIPALTAALVGLGLWKKLKVYELFVAGAREGFDTAVRIIPYLVATLVAVGMLRASGAMRLLTAPFAPFSSAVGLPAEVLPMALVRPLSGSGALGMMTELIQTYGADSYIGYVAATLHGCTETTFYVLAVYFGAVGVSRVRHAVAAGLAADLAGVVATGLVCELMFRAR